MVGWREGDGRLGQGDRGRVQQRGMEMGYDERGRSRVKKGGCGTGVFVPELSLPVSHQKKGHPSSQP